MALMAFFGILSTKCCKAHMTVLFDAKEARPWANAKESLFDTLSL